MPTLYIIGGPNGSGKTTTALKIMPRILDCLEYVNADTIAAGLSQFAPEAVAFQAGRLMLARLSYLSAQRQSFGFETTLAASSLAEFARNCQKDGYHVVLLYFWLQSADLAVQRVATRVAKGGHSIPEQVIRRRYAASIRNFSKLFRPMAANWYAYDNSSDRPILIAKGNDQGSEIVNLPSLWERIRSFES